MQTHLPAQRKTTTLILHVLLPLLIIISCYTNHHFILASPTTTSSSDEIELFTFEPHNLFHSNLFTIKKLEETFQLNETLTTNKTTNYGSCNPILFQLGDFSRDGPTLVYGICPDTYLATAVSITFLLAYVIVLIVSGFGLYLKRDSPHIKARNGIYMLMTILSNSGFIVMTCLRFIIGRRIYPCSLYVLSFFIIPPGILLPSVFRLWRLYLMHKKITYQKYQKVNETTTTTQPIVNKMMFKLEKSSETTCTTDTDTTTTTTTDTDCSNSYWLDNEEEMNLNEKRQKIFNILLSQKFIIATYIISFIFHIILFIFFGAIEEGIYNQDTSSKQRIFMGEGGFFVSSRGCIISNAITIIVAVEAVFYIAVELVFLILCFLIPRDTWFIKRETLLLIFLQFCSIILFATCGFIVQISKFTDFLIPFGFTLMSYSFAEVVICVLLPIIYSIYSKRRENCLEESELKQFLKNRKTFNMLLDFAKRSYCPESVLCYNDIERFKLTNRKNRKAAALHIAKTYLKPNAALELNFPKLSQTFDQVMKSIESFPETNLFETVQWQCVENMTDVFERLKSQSKETRKILQQWKSESTISSLNLKEKELNDSSPSLDSPMMILEQNHSFINVSNVEINLPISNSTSLNNTTMDSGKCEEREKTPIDNLYYL